MNIFETIQALQMLANPKMANMVKASNMWREAYEKVPEKLIEQQIAFNTEEKMFDDIMKNRNVSTYLKNKDLSKVAMTIIKYKNQKVR